MKKRSIRGIVTTALCLAFVNCTSPFAAVSAGLSSPSEMKDSGICYTESIGTINNPAAGYTKTIWPVCKPGSTPVYDPSENLVLFFIDIGAFSSGVNEDKKDYDLDEAFFDSWRKTFENARNNGCMIALRFRYDALGTDNPEPETFDMVLRHISQIKENGLLEDYKDIIAFVESGFVGKWGEQHGGKYTSTEYKAMLLETLLDCVPSPIPVTVRTPDIFAKLVGITRAELADYIPDEGSEAFRVGMYDDGYMGSSSDLGTYSDRAKETEWLGNQTVCTYFGGEFSGNLDYAKQFDTYLPENAIPEMYNTHLSYINANIFQLYKDYTFSAENDIKEVKYQPFSDTVSLEKTFDHSAYYGQTVYDFMRDHLGYRFVLRNSQLSDSAAQGGELKLDFKVENTGFANPIPHVSAELILEKNGSFMRVPVDIDANNWRSCTVASENLTAKLPDSLPIGEWNVYLKLSMGENTVTQTALRSIRFANDDVWNAALGANFLGSFNVTAAEENGTDNSLRCGDNSSDRMYSVSGQINCDGMDSFSGEWSEDAVIAENGENRLFMAADDKYVYFKAIIRGSADAPVYNLRIENAETDRSYWIYYASNGFVYFNNGSYDGCLCKHSGEVVEFRVPLGDTMALSPHTQLKSVRIFLQDSANDWVLIGDVKSGECSVPFDFASYTADTDIRLAKGESYTVQAITLLENARYSWYHDGVRIEGEESPELVIKGNSDADCGEYSVKISSEAGIEKTIPLCMLLEVKDAASVGDLNQDGKTDSADLILLRDYILGVGELTDEQLAAADLDSDGMISSLDEAILRRYC